MCNPKSLVSFFTHLQNRLAHRRAVCRLLSCLDCSWNMCRVYFYALQTCTHTIHALIIFVYAGPGASRMGRIRIPPVSAACECIHTHTYLPQSRLCMHENRLPKQLYPPPYRIHILAHIYSTTIVYGTILRVRLRDWGWNVTDSYPGKYKCVCVYFLTFDRWSF